MSATEVHVVKTAHSSCELLCNRGKSHSGKVLLIWEMCSQLLREKSKLAKKLCFDTVLVEFESRQLEILQSEVRVKFHCLCKI